MPKPHHFATTLRHVFRQRFFRRSDPSDDACLICELLCGSSAGLAAGTPQDARRSSSKRVKKVKKRLLKPEIARAILADLRAMDPSSNESTTSFRRSANESAPESLQQQLQERKTLSLHSSARLSQWSETVTAVQQQAFDQLGLASATFLRLASATDRTFPISVTEVTMLVYWWGYELALPPSVMVKLARARSIQQSFFWFLQAFIAAGGAPELAPFVRYIASYLDLEWSAVKAQDKGSGVVLAATWLLPVAMVPRPWDFETPERLHTS
ncbi:hypothetical protein JCM10908_006481 [Rhodotorula pacifica]|uniref:uncharacterized protein n=1 Tax=Rhodotorula pacifica TaxID=1495444 RepID=UPI003177B1AE